MRITIRRLLVAALTLASLAPAQTTRLSLRQAIDMALSPGTTAAQTSQLAVSSAQGKVIVAQNANALVAQAALADRIFRVDLRALGIDIPRFSQLISTVQFPGANGPYSLLDPRIQAAKTLIDKSAKRKIAVAREGVDEAKSVVREEREKIAAETARVYFDAVRASELVEVAGRNVKMAETLRTVAQERRANELGTQSEVRKATTNIAIENQKLSSARLEQTRAILRLLYLLGGDFGNTLELTDPLAPHDTTTTLDQAIAEAVRNNPHLATMALHDEGLKLTQSAITAAGLPVLSTYGDVGMNIVAPDPSNANPVSHSVTFTAGIEVKMVLLDGHRRAIAHAGVDAELRQQQIQERELRRQIELNVRLAWASLQEATTQVHLSDEGFHASEEDVAEIRAARAGGSASGLDLQQAETRQAAASDTRIAALHAQAEARVALAEAMGKVESLEW